MDVGIMIDCHKVADRSDTPKSEQSFFVDVAKKIALIHIMCAEWRNEYIPLDDVLKRE